MWKPGCNVAVPVNDGPVAVAVVQAPCQVSIWKKTFPIAGAIGLKLLWTLNVKLGVELGV